MTLVSTEPKHIYMWIEYVPRTFTISWEEKSNMSSGWTYSDDAAGLTAGDSAFDEFFGYYGCRLDTSGQETATITQADSGGAGKLDITQLGTLTSGDNVMIAFPVRGIKMTKSGSTVTLSITEELGKSGYQYYAHSTGTLSNPGTPKDTFYLGAYKGYYNSSITSGALKSWSGNYPLTTRRQADTCTIAKANGSRYNIIGWYQRMYINCLYMMKYGNPNSQTVVGKGYVGSGSVTVTGGTDSQKNATYGTSSDSQQIKLFGLEDWWGNIYEWVGGAYTDSSKYLYTQLSGYSGALSGGENTGSIIQNTTGNDLSSIVGNNKVLFGPSATINNPYYNAYYCDSQNVLASCLVNAGGALGSSVYAGTLYLDVTFGVSDSSNRLGARLLYL